MSKERGTPVVLTLTEVRIITHALSHLLTNHDYGPRNDIARLHQRFYELVGILVDLQPVEGPPA